MKRNDSTWQTCYSNPMLCNTVWTDSIEVKLVERTHTTPDYSILLLPVLLLSVVAMNVIYRR